MKLVQEHLNTCQACQSEARRYAEALAWLKEPVNTGTIDSPFTQEDFKSVRNSVMAQICNNQKGIPQKGWKRPASYLPWLLVVAAAIPAAIMIFGSKEFSAPNKSVSNVAANVEPSTAIDTTGANIGPAQIVPLANSVQPSAPAPQLPARPRTASKQSAEFLFAKNQPSDFEQDSTVTRIEFQTEDPNIKIIWFPNPRPSTISL